MSELNKVIYGQKGECSGVINTSSLKKKEKITPREFMARWKQGIKDITPSQMNLITIQGNILVLIGVVIGLIVTYSTKTWWLFIILLGSLFITSMGLLGSIQKQIVLNEFKKAMKGGNNKDEQERTA